MSKAVLFFDGMSKEQKKIQKDKVQSVKGWKIPKKNAKIQITFLDVKVYFLYFISMFFVFFVKIKKKYKCICSKIQNRKKYESTISKIQNTKKIRTQNFKNTKYKEKTNSKRSQGANPVFTVEIRKQIGKKKSKPTTCIFQTLQFWFVFFRFFWYF